MIQEAEAFLLLDDLHPCTNYSVSLATFLAIEDNTEGPVYTSEAVHDEFVTAANSDTEFQAGFNAKLREKFINAQVPIIRLHWYKWIRK